MPEAKLLHEKRARRKASGSRKVKKDWDRRATNAIAPASENKQSWTKKKVVE